MIIIKATKSHPKQKKMFSIEFQFGIRITNI